MPPCLCPAATRCLALPHTHIFSWQLRYFSGPLPASGAGAALILAVVPSASLLVCLVTTMERGLQVGSLAK